MRYCTPVNQAYTEDNAAQVRRLNKMASPGLVGFSWGGWGVLEKIDGGGDGSAGEGADEIKPQITHRAVAVHRVHQDQAASDGWVKRSAGDSAAGEGADHDGESNRQTKIRVALGLLRCRGVQHDKGQREGVEEFDEQGSLRGGGG